MTLSPAGVKNESKAEAEALIPLFKFQHILNQDQNGRRISLLGTIKDEAAVFTLERAAFPSDSAIISSFLSTLSNTNNLGANDIYRWYMSNHSPTAPLSTDVTSSEPLIPDLKLNLIWPCTSSHIKKYASQPLRYVTETASIYHTYIKPYVQRTQLTPARLDWIHNILDGITEQEDVIYHSPDYLSTKSPLSSSVTPTGFLLLPDLNWDRMTLSSLHLLALPQRRDISSLRDLRKSHIPWLKDMLAQIRTAAAARGTQLANMNTSKDHGQNVDDQNERKQGMDEDQVKCYVHYQPTYYHFHVHVVHVMLEAEGGTQSVGKAWGLETMIAMLENLQSRDGEDPGLDSVDLTYHVGEQSDLWKRCFEKIKKGETVDLLD